MSDFIANCAADLQITVEQVQQEFCAGRCMNPDCSRSQKAGKFDSRALNWKERLFTRPDKLPEEDPRFKEISRQGFMDTKQLEARVGSWADTTELETQSVEPPPKEAPQPAKPLPPPEEATLAEVDPVPKPAQTRKVAQPRRNTPFQQGTMLEGAPATAPQTPERDPWATPEPLQKDDRVLVPGQKIRMGV